MHINNMKLVSCGDVEIYSHAFIAFKWDCMWGQCGGINYMQHCAGMHQQMLLPAQAATYQLYTSPDGFLSVFEEL